MTNTKASSNYLNELRKIVWPIEWQELKKFLPMAEMMFFILFNYSMLRSVKDGFVVTDIGPESISFLKTYIVLPLAIIAIITYSKLCNLMAPQKVFYTVTGFFVAYLFSCFTLILA
jgi:AAA family ATP:ADP antiporter